MIAVIKSGRLLRASFYYNENKVAEGVARLLATVNYPVNAEDTTEQSRLDFLQRIADLRPNMKRPSMHISLNFAPGEHIPEDKLKQITQEYMQAIGFGDQPYLLYQHMDAAHPHVHILSLRVRPDGTTIDTFQIGKRLSRPAEQALEEKYNLVRSRDHRKGIYELRPVDVSIVNYGKVPTKRAISNVLSRVLDQYKYTSIHELNAVLRLYNVQAERGEAGSRLHSFNGLMYRVIDAAGKGISPALKASSFAYEATIKDLEKRFVKNDVQRQQSKPAVRVAIDKAMRNAGTIHFPALKSALKNAGIDLVLRQNNDGVPYGITYVDHRSKAVFNGSDLGKNYSVAGIIERLSANLQAGQVWPDTRQTKSVETDTIHQIPGATPPQSRQPAIPIPQQADDRSLLEMLLQPEYTNAYLPPELRGKRKKKKRKQHRL